MTLQKIALAYVAGKSHSKAYKLARLPREDPDQPAYSQNLISLYK